MALVVCETFVSLMGESTRAGVPAYFIRLTGCNLRCRYCDTAYAYEEGSEMTVGGLVDLARAQSHRLVLVTGGEPLLQAETPALLTDLLAAGFTVCLETNGSLPIGEVKCPGASPPGCEVSGERHGRSQSLGQFGYSDPPR